MGRRLTTTPFPQVTQLRVFVSVLDVNDNEPEFPFKVKVERVPEVSMREAREGQKLGHEGSGGLDHGAGPMARPPPSISQDTEVNAIVIPEKELEAQDRDKDDILFYTLQEVTPVSTHTLTPPQPQLPPVPLGTTLPCASSQSLRLCPPPPQGARNFFSLVGANRPALRLDQTLDLERWPNMTFQLLVRVSRPPPC